MIIVMLMDMLLQIIMKIHYHAFAGYNINEGMATFNRAGD